MWLKYSLQRSSWSYNFPSHEMGDTNATSVVQPQPILFPGTAFTLGGAVVVDRGGFVAQHDPSSLRQDEDENEQSEISRGHPHKTATGSISDSLTRTDFVPHSVSPPTVHSRDDANCPTTTTTTPAIGSRPHYTVELTKSTVLR